MKELKILSASLLNLQIRFLTGSMNVYIHKVLKMRSLSIIYGLELGFQFLLNIQLR